MNHFVITRMPVWLGIILGTIVGGIFGLLIGLLVLRLRAAYLALFTLGFSEILRATISAEIQITRGQAGIELPSLFENGITVAGHVFSKTDKIPPYFVMFFLIARMPRDPLLAIPFTFWTICAGASRRSRCSSCAWC